MAASRFAAVALLVCVTSAHRITPYCNFPCPGCTVAAFDYAACNTTQTGNECNLAGCRPWSQGAFPHYNGDTPVNGGIPQRGNITLHVALLEAGIARWLPDPDYDGNAVFDFEDWTPVWGQNTGGGSWHSRKYQDESVAMVRAEHPTWTDAQVRAAAEAAFEAAAIDWFATSLETGRRLRPRAKWGFYGLPQGKWGGCDFALFPAKRADGCGYANAALGPKLRADNDKLARVWAASSGLFPSVYFPPQPPIVMNESVWQWVNYQYALDTTRETIRLATTYRVNSSGPVAPVRPFWWGMYHNGSTFLLPSDVANTLEATFQPPHAVGLVQWGSRSDAAATAAWFNGVAGPAVKAFVSAADACAQTHCSGHGWCVPGPTPDAPPTCVCDPGADGPTCND